MPRPNFAEMCSEEFEEALQLIEAEDHRGGIAHRKAVAEHKPWRAISRLPRPSKQAAEEAERVIREAGL